MDDIIMFPGPHGDLFAGYVSYKRSLGYAIPVSYQYVLREIARFIAEEQVDPDIVSRDMVEKLTARKPGEAVSTRCKRIAILRQLCLWVAAKGYTPAIPPEGLVRKRHHHGNLCPGEHRGQTTGYRIGRTEDHSAKPVRE